MANADSLTVPRLLAIIETQCEIASGGLGLEAVMRLVSERAQVLTHADGAVVELVDGDWMVYRAATGTAGGNEGLRLRRSTSLSGLCVQCAEPLRCDDADTDSRVDKDACRRVGVRSMICVPLFHEGIAVGALKVMSSQTATFDEADVETLRLLASVIAAAMKHGASMDAAERASRQDALTGLPNRRAYDEELAAVIADGTRAPLSLALLDLDGFKGANDRWGHPAGDRILCEVGIILQGGLRKGDRCFRIGGDEFAILMPATTGHGALAVVSASATAVRDASLSEGTIGISAGIAEAEPEERAESLHARADQKLYEAKRSRKDRPALRSIRPEFPLHVPSIRPRAT